MTSYTIHVGYNSSHHSDEVWKCITEAVRMLRQHPELIIAEVKRIEPDADHTQLVSCANMYKEEHVDDLAIRIDAEKHEVVQLAGGGGAYRRTKEALRRAVCRLVMEHCHRNAMEISITVW